jgi:hypothetical protein
MQKTGLGFWQNKNGTASGFASGADINVEVTT